MSDDAAEDLKSVGNALRWGRRQLAMAATESPGLDAEVLLRHALGIERAALFARLNDAIDSRDVVDYRQLLEKRARGVPIAYLIGVREFMGLGFGVGPDVLIPRPETEILVEWALKWLGGREGGTIADVGTGSGAIALSLAALLPHDPKRRIIAVDISAAALLVAERNRRRMGLENRVQLVQGSLLEPVEPPVDLILANLPYLRPDQISGNPLLASEPRLALDGGGDGLDLVRGLLADAARVVRSGAAIVLEIDPDQRDTLVDFAAVAFPNARTDVLQDLAGLARHVVIQLNTDS